MVDLSIVIVSWNVRELLSRCLASIYREMAWGEWRSVAGKTGRIWQPPEDDDEDLASCRTLEVVVVDNASTDGSAEMLAQQFPQVRLIANRTNLGFSRGSNRGLQASTGRYLLLLNPDTELVGGALRVLVDYMDAHADVGAAGPRLLNPDGSLQSSRRRFPTLSTAFVESTVLQRYFPRASTLAHYYCEDLPVDEEQEVDWVVGAALLVRRDATQQVGVLDEDFFMYSEEMEWCYRMKRAGWKVVYLPQAEVIHHHGRSSEQVPSRRDIYFHSSKCLFFRKHHGRGASTVLRAFLLSTYLFQIGEEGGKLLLGHKPALRRERLVRLLEVVRSGLNPCAAPQSGDTLEEAGPRRLRATRDRF